MSRWPVRRFALPGSGCRLPWNKGRKFAVARLYYASQLQGYVMREDQEKKLHIRNSTAEFLIFTQQAGELDEKAVCRDFRHTAEDGNASLGHGR